MVFQNYALYPHLDVRANIAFALEMRGMSRRDIAGRVTAVAERFGLAELLKRKPAELSGGQRQRVALARTIVRQPKVFLLDEPLSNLDARVRMEMRADLLELHETLGSTMIYVTHDQVEAMTLGQRMAILHEGRLRQVGTPADVYERPADIFVARFVGNPGMNVLTGTAAALEDGVLHCGSLRVPVASHHYTAEGHIGIRPEHVTLGALNRGIGNALVRVVEPLGSETLVHLDAGGQPLVARVRGLGKLKTGDRVGVRLADEHLHVFDVHGDRIG